MSDTVAASIVNIASTSACLDGLGPGRYAATKAAIQLSPVVAVQYEGKGFASTRGAGQCTLPWWRRGWRGSEPAATSRRSCGSAADPLGFMGTHGHGQRTLFWPPTKHGSSPERAGGGRRHDESLRLKNIGSYRPQPSLNFHERADMPRKFR